MSTFHSLTIKEIIKETPSAVSIEFEVPDSLSNDFSFIPGQYLTLKAEINGNEVRRAYSICSSSTSGSLKVAVKEVENGIFSTYANRSLQKGDRLEVSIPEGKFTLDINQGNSNHYGAFACGSGITPILSMILSVLENEPNSTFSLVYGNKSIQETIFYDEIEALKTKYADRFEILYVFSRENVEGNLFGRIDTSVVNFVLKNKFKEKSFSNYYLCGPEGMIKLTEQILLDNGVDKGTISFELFTASTSENEVTTGYFDKASVKIIVDDEEFTISVDADKLILDACLEEDIDVPYSCQGGVCSSCIAKVQEGKATMVKNAILTDGEIQDGLILACQALAQSSNLVVDFDDV
ncbi:MAG: ferredoxin--NADP reductase [Flavobacteriaceae bacterium]|nr:ferredoxin--NADP reductase [Flavobacteriaceae bacterium]